MWKQILIASGAAGLIAGSCLVARAQAPSDGHKLVGAWMREPQRSQPNSDRMVLRDDRTVVLTERAERLPGSWKPVEKNRLQFTLTAEKNMVRVLEWKMLDGGVLRLWDTKHRNDGPTFWVRVPASARQPVRKPVAARPIWELPQYRDGRPVCDRCDSSDFGRPRDWQKHSEDGRTVTCGVCGTPYVFMLPNGTPYRPTKLAKAVRKGRYSAFRKLISREGTWKLQAGSNASLISFNTSRGTAFVSGKKWLWEEVGKDHVQVTYEGERQPRDWKWEASDDRRVILVSESVPGASPVKRRNFSLIRDVR
jgi:hypothetical protein